ncbi:chaplin [Streptomyces olivochromogenes]|uniref:Membrane protein n=1 Tax=Streptomyces olivochromogenes TaxID=1963 RepID=A0A250VRR3_STROL|nr:chaplin [Streptomyces olivochromogenes]KUN43947.1 chaplin [Streptomyces olivochromogenes]GAX56786.1 membrane protein [Streptomyces olivochromogenes]
MRIRLMAAAGLAGVALLATAGTSAAADPTPVGAAADSPGLLSGNVIQIPVDLGLNLCGDSIDLVGLLNPAAGTACTND